MIQLAENIMYDEELDICYQDSVRNFMDLKIAQNSTVEYDEYGREKKYTAIYKEFIFTYQIFYKYSYGHESAWEPLKTEYKIEKNG